MTAHKSVICLWIICPSVFLAGPPSLCRVTPSVTTRKRRGYTRHILHRKWHFQQWCHHKSTQKAGSGCFSSLSHITFCSLTLHTDLCKLLKLVSYTNWHTGSLFTSSFSLCSSCLFHFLFLCFFFCFFYHFHLFHCSLALTGESPT